ncbi:DUF2157 domain-containing protein [candidate division KSB1 bacterium]
MEKETFLEQLREAVRKGIVTKKDILNAYGEVLNETGKADEKRFSISRILNYVGGAIIIAGISILIGQNWDILNSASKILATLGSGIAVYITGTLLYRYEKFRLTSLAFYLVSSAVIPIGLYIIFDIAGYNKDALISQSFYSSVMLIIFGITFFLRSHILFLLFNMVYGTWLFISFTGYLVEVNPVLATPAFFQIRLVLIGLSCIFIGYYLKEGNYSGLTHWVYSIGIIGVLTAMIDMCGGKDDPNRPIEILYPVITFGTIFLSIVLKTKTFLIFGSLFLMIYIARITTLYFSEGLGWPLALVLSGMLLIGIGYAALHLQRKYIPK